MRTTPILNLKAFSSLQCIPCAVCLENTNWKHTNKAEQFSDECAFFFFFFTKYSKSSEVGETGKYFPKRIPNSQSSAKALLSITCYNFDEDEC